MLTTEQQKELQPKLRSLLMVFAGLGMGMLTMLVVIALIVDWKKLSFEAGMLPLMAAITGLMTYGMSFIIPKLLSTRPADMAAALTKQRGSTDIPIRDLIKSLVGNLISHKIIAGALIEGGVLLNLIVFFIDSNTVSLAVVVIGLLIFAFRFPFPGRQLSRIESELDEIQRELKLLQR